MSVVSFIVTVPSVANCCNWSDLRRVRGVVYCAFEKYATCIKVNEPVKSVSVTPLLSLLDYKGYLSTLT